MKTVLITGAHGFISQHLIKKLEGLACQVITYTKDVTNHSDVETFLNSTPHVDWTYHLAAISSPAECKQSPSHAFKVNAEGARIFANLVADRFPKSHFIFTSTGQVYKGHVDAKLDENSEVNPINLYAETKRKAEEYLEEIHRNTNLSTNVFRLFNHSHKTQPAHFFLPSLYGQILSGKREIRTGNLNLIRDIGSIQDLLEALCAPLKKETPSGYQIYNICSGTEKKLEDLALEMAHSMNRSVHFSTDPALVRKDEPYRILGNCEKFKNAFNWEPKRSADAKSLINSFLEDI